MKTTEPVSVPLSSELICRTDSLALNRGRFIAEAVRAREARPLGGEKPLVDFIVWLITPEW